MSAIQVLCVVALTGIGLALTAPQTLLLLRGRVAAGVSIPGLISSVLSYIAWAGFAAGVHDRVFVLSLLLPGALELLTLTLSIRYRGEWHGWWVPLVWAGCLLLAVRLGLVALGALLAVSIIWEYGPPTWESWHTPDVSGVSLPAWRLRVLDGALWGGYGLLVWNVQLVIAGVSALLLALVVLAGLRAPFHVGATPVRERVSEST